MGATEAPIKPLRPTPNLITAGDLHDYVDLLDPLIKSLNNDVQTNVATGNSAELESQATALEYMASKIEDAEPAYAAELKDRAAAKRALAKKGTIDPAALDMQEKFAVSWDAFYARWTKEAAAVRSILVLTSGGDWTQLQAYDVEYQSLYRQFIALGFKPTMNPPPPPPDTPALIPAWLPWLVGGAIVIVALSFVAPMLTRLIPAKA